MDEPKVNSLYSKFTRIEKFTAGLMLLSGLLITGLTYDFVSSTHLQRSVNAFEHKATDTANTLSVILDRHTGLLSGMQALYHSSNEVTRLEFYRYFQSSEIEQNHPAAAAISWNARVPFDRATEFENSVRTDTSLIANGYPNFTIKPALKENAEGIVITYIEPFASNESAFGFDIGSNPARRAAAHKARDSGAVVITEPIVLTQDSGSTQKAFLMLMPTYSTAKPAFERTRRIEHTGYVVAVTRAAEFIENSEQENFSFFQVLDTTSQNSPVEDRILYSTGVQTTTKLKLETVREIHFGTRTWQLSFQENTYGNASDQVVEFLILGLGILASILAAMLFGSLTTSKRKAEQHAEKLNINLHKANDELKRSNADLSQFAHVASHDLQTPVRNVISTVTLLEEHLGDSADPEVIELFDLLARSSVRMRTLVSDLLSYARLGRDAINFEVVDLNVVMQDVLATISELSLQTGSEIKLGLLPNMTGDARQLNRVFENLLTNAIKYAHTTRPAVIEISEQDSDPTFVKIRVTDNGQGIKEEYQDMVFEPFKRLHRHDEIPGTGLGLGICQQIVERHGGTITIEQSTEEGTTFLLALPRHAHKSKVS